MCACSLNRRMWRAFAQSCSPTATCVICPSINKSKGWSSALGTNFMKCSSRYLLKIRALDHIVSDTLRLTTGAVLSTVFFYISTVRSSTPLVKFNKIASSVLVKATWVISPLQYETHRIWGNEIGCLESHTTIFQLNMWRNIDVQVDWGSWTCGRAPNAIYIS